MGAKKKTKKRVADEQVPAFKSVGADGKVKRDEEQLAERMRRRAGHRVGFMGQPINGCRLSIFLGGEPPVVQ